MDLDLGSCSRLRNMALMSRTQDYLLASHIYCSKTAEALTSITPKAYTPHSSSICTIYVLLIALLRGEDAAEARQDIILVGLGSPTAHRAAFVAEESCKATDMSAQFATESLSLSASFVASKRKKKKKKRNGHASTAHMPKYQGACFDRLRLFTSSSLHQSPCH
jgi:hypothetical protein